MSILDPNSFGPGQGPDPDLLSDCVHCGFCLPTCPTYQLWGEEMDSPRGRIHLMNLASQGEIAVDDTFAGHIDACLGCMACVSACPSGVQYDRLIESVRPRVEELVPRTRMDRLFRAFVFFLFPHPARLRVAALGALFYQRSGLRRLMHASGLIKRLPARLRALEALMPPLGARNIIARPRGSAAALTPARRKVAVVPGCVQRVFFAEVNDATVRVLAAEGCAVEVPQTRCCGALSVHAGREDEGLERARATIRDFEALDIDDIVINVAGCGSTLKEYGALLADDPEYAERATEFSAKVRDISEVLAGLEPIAPRNPIQATVAYHDACHLAHGQQIRSEPRKMLATVPELTVRDIPDAAVCCGSAGIYNLVQPDAAEELGRRKAETIRSVDADAVTTGNPGCLLQIRRHLDELPIVHPVQIIDASIRGENPFDA